MITTGDSYSTDEATVAGLSFENIPGFIIAGVFCFQKILWVDIAHGFDPGPAMNGLGTVHHVAFAIGTPEEQLALREDLLGRGVRVTVVRDRQYFQSIYFPTPGGVLFEVATMAPGFAVDEPLASLGQSLRLPPWEEGNRSSIEHGLPRVTR